MNDERPIEKSLRRYAKKRRDDAGAPVELHPATRRLLQGEAARQFPKRASASEGETTTFDQVLKLWRRQLLWALPVLIVLGIGVWVLVGSGRKPRHEFDLAKNASPPAAPAEVVESPFKALETTTPATAAPATSFGDQPTLAYAKGGPVSDGLELNGVALKGETILLKQSDAKTAHDLAANSQNEPTMKFGDAQVAANNFAQLATADQLRGQTVVGKRALDEESGPFSGEKAKAKNLSRSSPAKSDSLENFESIRKDYVAASEGRLAVAPASKPAVLAPETSSARYFKQETRGGGERDKLQVNSRAFVNRAPAPTDEKMAKPSGITPVLVNFQVEQIGNQLRVIDGDGSTYLGEMNAPVEEKIVKVEVGKNGAESSSLRSGDKLVVRRVDAQASEQQGVQNFAYRVTGTNRTLNQQVVFTWNFVELTNGSAAAQYKVPAGAGNVLQNNMPAQQLPLLLNNSVINGRAQLGRAKEIEINAVPVPP